MYFFIRDGFGGLSLVSSQEGGC